MMATAVMKEFEPIDSSPGLGDQELRRDRMPVHQLLSEDERYFLNPLPTIGKYSLRRVCLALTSNVEKLSGQVAASATGRRLSLRKSFYHRRFCYI